VTAPDVRKSRIVQVGGDLQSNDASDCGVARGIRFSGAVRNDVRELQICHIPRPAVIGKLIWLGALALVWWRMLIVAVLLSLWPPCWRAVARIRTRLVWIYAGIGVVIALHWWSFYGAVKLANASVAATCMALSPLLLAFVEPLVTRRRFEVRELWFGLAAIPGVALVVGGTSDSMRIGIVVGAFSAFAVAVFGALNKRFVGESDALTVTGIEMAAGVVTLSLIALGLPSSQSPYIVPARHDVFLLVVLAIVCTIVPFALCLVALRQLSAYSTMLAVNLEPVYAIVLASLLLGEQRELTRTFYLGVAILLVVIFGHPLWVRRSQLAEADESSPKIPENID
jgi:drug/metabolite transporter (DMT)-like permease